MSRYSPEFRESIVKKMMPPNAQSVASISRETGICSPTLYSWRNQSRKEGSVVPADPSNPDNWSGADKLAVIIETASLNEAELSEYCRRKGLFVEQIQRWKEGAISGNEASGSRLTAAERTEIKHSRQRTRQLEKELARKEKALAEAAALLVLKKKLNAMWGESEDE